MGIIFAKFYELCICLLAADAGHDHETDPDEFHVVIVAEPLEAFIKRSQGCEVTVESVRDFLELLVVMKVFNEDGVFIKDGIEVSFEKVAALVMDIDKREELSVEGDELRNGWFPLSKRHELSQWFPFEEGQKAVESFRVSIR